MLPRLGAWIMNRPTRLFALCSCVLAMNGCFGGGAFDEPLYKALITYTSGNLKITGLLSKPPGRGPFPLLLINHGDPATASSIAYFMDLFSTKGFVTLASDLRGNGKSEGTREFDKGEVDNVLNALEYARGLSYVDSRRVGVMGISSGASLALLAASRSPAIRAVVAIQGPIEQAECYKSWVEKKDHFDSETLIGLVSLIGGTPDQVPEEWKIRSPLYGADRIQCPVLLIYSDRDDVVPVDQSRRMETALQQAGNRSARLIMVEGAPHGLDQKSWPDVTTAMTDFLNKELKTGGP